MAFEKLRHKVRWLTSQWRSNAIAVAGAYHYENVGDMALALTAMSLLRQRPETDGAGVVLQTSANLYRWRKPERLIVWGGAILNTDVMDHIIAHVDGQPERAALFGVEIRRDSDAFSAHHFDFLRAVPYLSVRNRVHQKYFLEHDVPNVRHHPDAVFAWPHLNRTRQPAPPESNARTPVAGVNIVGGCGCDVKRDAIKEAQVKDGYRDFVRGSVDQLIGRGYAIQHFPFTPGDDQAARIVLDDMDVVFHPYDWRPDAMAVNMSSCDIFIPSRFHALIYCMKLSIPCLPFLYARKNYWLMEDYFPAFNVIGFRELEQSRTGALGHRSSALFDEAAVAQMGALVRAEFSLMIDALRAR